MDSVRELLKLKIKDNEVFLKYQVTGSGFPETVTLESTEPPRKELRDALQKMVDHVVDLCELPPSWREDMTVRSVTVTHNDVDGLVITALRDLDNSNAPMVVNTPHFTRSGRDENQEPGIYSCDCGRDLDELERLALEYADGRRQQQVLEFETEEEPEPDLVLST